MCCSSWIDLHWDSQRKSLMQPPTHASWGLCARWHTLTRLRTLHPWDCGRMRRLPPQRCHGGLKRQHVGLDNGFRGLGVNPCMTPGRRRGGWFQLVVPSIYLLWNLNSFLHWSGGLAVRVKLMVLLWPSCLNPLSQPAFSSSSWDLHQRSIGFPDSDALRATESPGDMEWLLTPRKKSAL